VIQADRASMHGEARGKQREDLVLEVLMEDGHRFRKVQLPNEGPLVDPSLASLSLRRTHGVAIPRPGERIVAPPGDMVLRAEDELIVVARPEDLNRFEEAMA